MNKKILEAIDKLIRFYDSFEPEDAIPPCYSVYYDTQCPLCEAVMENSSICNCLFCPWLTIEKINCLKGKYLEQTIDQRLFRLRRWKKGN